ncbi:Sec-independent protein translocase protein TatB [Thiolinea disciformis]|uniref:Sec-independent protein translocase protein TatB n=1 Tax=Thiolinea disciformis TaxID=125614 RepID=UPI00036BF77C|nr:Sec-independent protein translocase protein TatB [Thiolinea disciformis]
MFEASFLEMLVVAVVALVVVGPERLPGLAAKAGRMLGKLRAFVATTRSDIERELQATELRDLLSKQEHELRDLRNMMYAKADSLQQDIRATSQTAETSFRSAADSAKAALNADASTKDNSPSP